MTTPAIPLPEFDQEMASTRKLLERIPDEQGRWKPHPKSFPLGHLAQLVARMPGILARTLRQDVVDLAQLGGYSFEPTSALLRELDGNVREAREALAAVTGADLDVPWSLTSGAHVLLTAPRGVAVRQHLNHIIHHRAQLTVYLRLLDVPVPAIYGPSADERS